jgi:sialic acid synthase SpsE
MIEIAGHTAVDGYPVYIIAEIGINHNGDINIAKKLIDAAVLAGCDGVKFQKTHSRTVCLFRAAQCDAGDTVGAHNLHGVPVCLPHCLPRA